MSPMLRDMLIGMGLLIALTVVLSGAIWAVGYGVHRMRDHYDRDRIEGTVGIEDPTGGDES